jgi:formate dehydrogenase beta subunit
VFAGGDMVPPTRSVTVGIGDGKTAARNIDARLRRAPAPTQPQREPAEYDTLNTW